MKFHQEIKKIEFFSLLINFFNEFQIYEKWQNERVKSYKGQKDFFSSQQSISLT